MQTCDKAYAASLSNCFQRIAVRNAFKGWQCQVGSKALTGCDGKEMAILHTRELSENGMELDVRHVSID